MSENSDPNEALDEELNKDLSSDADSYVQAMQSLRGGIQQLPTPRASSDLQSKVLQTLTSGRDFDPWPQQMGRRLHWMLLPALAGAVCTAIALQFTPDFLHSQRQSAGAVSSPPPALKPLRLSSEDRDAVTGVLSPIRPLNNTRSVSLSHRNHLSFRTKKGN